MPTRALIGAVESLRQHKPFLTSKVTEFVLDDYIRRGGLREDAPRDAITPREREVIRLLAEGNSDKETAAALGVSVKTIEAHRGNIMRKLRLRSVTDLVRYATRNKISSSRKTVSCRIRPGVNEPSHKRLIGRKVTVRFVVDLRRRPLM
jgi:DNA-binding NarL/FixJ family response regulator